MEVDDALSKLMKMSLGEFEKFTAQTVSESMAYRLLKHAIESDDIKGIQVVLDRTQGRPTAKKQQEEVSNELLEKIQGLMGK